MPARLLNSGKFSYCLNVSTVAALTTGTVQTYGYFTIFFLLFDSIITGSLYYNMCTCYFHTTNLQHLGQHKTTLVDTRHVSWTQNCPGPCWKSFPRCRFAGGEEKVRKGKQLEGKNDEKGLQCSEFLTWKVGNPT